MKTSIDCKFQKQSALFVDFQAKLWPCCWTGAPVHFAKIDNIQTKQIHSLMEQYGEKFNSLRHHSLEDVLNHEWFANSLVSSWNSDKKTYDMW